VGLLCIILSRTNSVGQLLEEEAMQSLEVEIHDFQLVGPDDCKPLGSSLQTIKAVAAAVAAVVDTLLVLD